MSLFSRLGYDELEHIFRCLFVVGGDDDPWNFATTCKATAQAFVLGLDPEGKDVFQNYIDFRRMRIFPTRHRHDLVFRNGYSEARQRQLRTRELLRCFLRADRTQTLHCALPDSCCSASRAVFNATPRNGFRVDSASSMASYGCFAIDPEGKHVAFVLTRVSEVRDPARFAMPNGQGQGRSVEPNHYCIVCRRSRLVVDEEADEVEECDDSAGCRPPTRVVEDEDVVLLLNNDRVLMLLGMGRDLVRKPVFVKMACSSDGRWLAVMYDISWPGYAEKVTLLWDTHVDRVCRLHMTVGLPELGFTRYVRSECVRNTEFWFATDDETGVEYLMLGWTTGRARVHGVHEEQDVTIVPHLDSTGFFVTSHWSSSQGVFGKTDIMLSFQRSSTKCPFFCNWSVVVPVEFVDRKQAVSVFRIRTPSQRESIEDAASRDPMSVCSVSCLNTPDRVMGSASHEQFHSVYSASVTNDGKHLCILSRSAVHFYSPFPVSSDHLFLALFTRDESETMYYRKNAANDEVFIPFESESQDPWYFRVAFTPCASALLVTYALNFFGISPFFTGPSGYVIKIERGGIQRSNAIVNTKLKSIMLANTSSDAACVMGKYGILIFRRIASATRR